MIFLGNGIAWDGEKNCVLARFIDGEFETTDADKIAKLSKIGYNTKYNIKEDKTPTLNAEKTKVAPKTVTKSRGTKK